MKYKNCKSYIMGHKVKSNFTNVLQLANSCNDEYDGCLDFIYYKVLNMNPIRFFETIEKEYDNKSDTCDIQMCEKMFQKYSNKVKLTDEMTEEIDNVIAYIRKRAIEENKIRKEGHEYIPSVFFTFPYMKKLILKYYSEERREKK